jgi:hypothetical protein
MTFRERAQCDRAIDHFSARQGSAESNHRTVYSKVKDEIFICWKDLQEG